jgi:uncharacterized membrane protein
MSTLPADAERFLTDLARALGPLPAAERDDLVAELRSHLAERAAQGATELLAPFGRAEDYAAAFLEERSLSGALARGTPWALWSAVFSGARRLAWWYVVLSLGLVQVVSAVLILLGILKVVFPGGVGLYLHGGDLLLQASFGGGAPAGIELLGWWAVPIFLGTGGLALWSSLAVLRALARWRLARLRPALAR